MQRIGIEVPVELRFADRSIRLMSKIDTGASFCFFQREYAEELGIDVVSGRKEFVTTVNGQFATYGHIVQLMCLGLSSEATVYFYEQTNWGRNVLGRAGWLDQHRLGLIDHDRSVYLGHYNDTAPW